jgi:hypothetical protein
MRQGIGGARQSMYERRSPCDDGRGMSCTLVGEPRWVDGEWQCVADIGCRPVTFYLSGRDAVTPPAPAAVARVREIAQDFDALHRSVATLLD